MPAKVKVPRKRSRSVRNRAVQVPRKALETFLDHRLEERGFDIRPTWQFHFEKTLGGQRHGGGERGPRHIKVEKTSARGFTILVNPDLGDYAFLLRIDELPVNMGPGGVSESLAEEDLAKAASLLPKSEPPEDGDQAAAKAATLKTLRGVPRDRELVEYFQLTVGMVLEANDLRLSDRLRPEGADRAIREAFPGLVSVSPMARSRFLTELVKQGDLVEAGSGRSRRLGLPDEAVEMLGGTPVDWRMPERARLIIEDDEMRDLMTFVEGLVFKLTEMQEELSGMQRGIEAVLAPLLENLDAPKPSPEDMKRAISGALEVLRKPER